MRTLLYAAARFAREEDAPTMIEYVLLMAAVALLVGMTGHWFAQVCSEIFRDAALVANVR